MNPLITVAIYLFGIPVLFHGLKLSRRNTDDLSDLLGESEWELPKYGGKQGKGKFRPLRADEVLAKSYGAEFWYRTDRGDVVRVRVSGKPKTWKTRPGVFEVPVKYGMWESFRITDRDVAAGRALKEL